MKRVLSLLLLFVICLTLAACQKEAPATAVPTEAPTQAPAAEATAEPDTDPFVATVNGEKLLYNDYNSIESAYLYQYESAGVDLSDPEVYAYLQDLALTYAIEQMLIKQDMRAQGCYDFTAEEETWFVEMGQAAYATALQNVCDVLLSSGSSEDEAMVYALAYAQSLGVTEETYVDYYRTQYASARYYEWLTQDQPVTDADVLSAYAERTTQSELLYANDVAAFETALNVGSEVWYKPAGYRSILQILLPAEGATAEEKLLNVQETLDTIYARLNNGETFQALIAEYGIDTNFADEAFLSTGYQVHQDSVVWEDAFIAAAFSAEMAQPGDVSQPFASDLGVHILYYLCDSPSGAIALTEEVHAALASALYTERYTAAQNARIQLLADAAEIIIP